MEQLFNDMQTRIAEIMGESVSLIDEDYGQLEALLNGEEQYPITFPCILITTPEVQWKDLKTGIQHGQATLAVRIAFDCYDDTYYNSTQEHHVAERMNTVNKLNGYLNGWKFEGCATALLRQTSRQFSLPGGIKVYEIEYATTVYDTTLEQKNTTCKPRPKIKIIDVSNHPVGG